MNWRVPKDHLVDFKDLGVVDQIRGKPEFNVFQGLFRQRDCDLEPGTLFSCGRLIFEKMMRDGDSPMFEKIGFANGNSRRNANSLDGLCGLLHRFASNLST